MGGRPLPERNPVPLTRLHESDSRYPLWFELWQITVYCVGSITLIFEPGFVLSIVKVYEILNNNNYYSYSKKERAFYPAFPKEWFYQILVKKVFFSR